MNLREFNKCISMFEECEIAPSNSGVFLLDKKREPFGELNFYTNTFTLYEDYEHSAKIEHKLQSRGITLFDRAMNRDIIFDNEKPVLR